MSDFINDNWDLMTVVVIGLLGAIQIIPPLVALGALIMYSSLRMVINFFKLEKEVSK